MKTSKLTIAIGAVLLTLFSPALLIGFLAHWVKLYFDAGYEIGEVIYDWLDERLDKYEH